VALCADCHKFVHEWADGRPRDWQDEDDGLIALVADYEATLGKNSN
jgi:glycine betaine/choline ABC-type transport system substrate-binding protein